MSQYPPRPASLALYKQAPALVGAVAEKIEISLPGGGVKRVRPKDLQILHPGPLADLDALRPAVGDVSEAWELLAGSETDLKEVAELAFGEFTPNAAWSVWQLLADGLYFTGEPWKIQAVSEAEVARVQQERQAKAQAEQEWSAFIERMRRGEMAADDRKRLAEVERLALGQGESSRILQALGHPEKPEFAHRFLVSLGYWTETHNPYPQRQGLPLEDPALEMPPLGAAAREDLTHLPAFAIDDAWSHDPDDAISLDGERIWVHIADAGALIAPDSAADLEARARTGNLYLPERTVHMLPPAATLELGLGLQDTSPALSVCFTVTAQGELEAIRLVQSRLRVTRYSYAEAEGLMGEAPFAQLLAAARRFQERRMAAGAVNIDLPEASVRVRGEEILIAPLERHSSREMVTECMLMAGEAVARYALENALPIPFVSQPPPATAARPSAPAETYAFRKTLKPSQVKTLEEPHSGLGLPLYTRVTSPLRRYLDLVTHQQLLAHLQGTAPMDADQVAERIGAAMAVSGGLRKAERFSNLHWKLIFLQRHPGWQGDGVVVEVQERRATVLIPELAMETKIRLNQEPALDSWLRLQIRELDVPAQVAWFRVLKS